jgi:hypothetical protein
VLRNSQTGVERKKRDSKSRFQAATWKRQLGSSNFGLELFWNKEREREVRKDGAADVRVVQRPKSSSYQTTQPATGLFFSPMKEKKAKD